MATKKAKPITRGELAGLSHAELATVKTKRRIMASLPSEPAAAKPKPKASEETLSPRQRIERGYEKADQARLKGDANE